MFEQMSAERFEQMRNGVGLSPDDACSALEELLLYRELGTLQQLSLATDAVGEARTLRARVAELEAVSLHALWHHQGAGSEVGQPIRAVLGIGRYAPLTMDQVRIAKSVAVRTSHE